MRTRALSVAGWLLIPAALSALSVPASSGGRAPSGPALSLGESRPLETALGDSTLPSAQSVWIEMIRSSRRSLDLEHFYLSHRPGEALQPVLDELGRAAARGVKVRLLLDASMSRTYPQPADSLSRLPNVSFRVVDYRRLARGVQHAKFMVVDGDEAWIGSQNLDWRALTQIHELGIRMREPRLAGAVASVFETDWAAADTTRPFAPTLGPGVRWPLRVSQGGGRTAEAWLGATPRATTPEGIPWDRDLIVARLAAARRTVVVQTLQYGVGSHGVADSTLHQALLGAAARGVTVRLLVSDWVLGGANEDALRDLARHGVQVRISRLPEFSGGYISFARVEHCKYMAVDGEWLWVGTSNWEPSYFTSSRNLGVTVHDPALARRAEAVFATGWSAPSALVYGPDTRLEPRPHGETPPEGSRLY